MHEKAEVTAVHELGKDCGVDEFTIEDSHHEMAEDNLVEGLDAGEDHVNGEFPSSNEECGGGKKKRYVARLPRRIMPCKSDSIDLADFLFGVEGAIANFLSKGNDDASAYQERTIRTCDLYVVFDHNRICEECSFELICSEESRNCSVLRCRATVHTLLHGSIEIAVLDLICRASKSNTLFGGRDFSTIFMVIYNRLLSRYFNSWCKIYSIRWATFVSQTSVQ